MAADLEARIRVVSDGDLFAEAVAFAAEVVQFAPRPKDLTPAQLNGLLQYSRGELSELERYVAHQAARRWEARGREVHPTKRFYDGLKARLAQLRQRGRLESWALVRAGLPDNQFRHQAHAIATRLARDFIRHLVAEIFYRRSTSGGGHGATDQPDEV